MGKLEGLVVTDDEGNKYRLVSTDSSLGISDLKDLRGMGLGNIIKEKRSERGLSQRGLAKLAGISHAQLNKIETGKINKPHECMLQSIISELGKIAKVSR